MNTYVFVVTTDEQVVVTAENDDEAYEKAWAGDWDSSEVFNTEYVLDDVTSYGEEDDSISN
jgi:protein tyrosine phosphatase